MNDALSLLIIVSRADLKQAKRLQSFLLKYKVPKQLASTKGLDGVVPSCITQSYISIEQPISNDGEALSARYAIVLCSPEAVASADVHDWLLAYKRKHNESQVLCYILSGEPNASDKPGSLQAEAFPEGVRFFIDKQGQLSNKRTEPIAADSRQHADGENNARLKLLAGILAVPYEALHQRARKQQKQRLVVAAAIFFLIVGYGINLYWQQHKQTQAKLQEEFISASMAIFDNLNRQKSGMMKQVNELRKLATQVEGSEVTMQALDFRLSHSQLKGQDVAPNQTVDFVLASNHGKAYGVSLFEGILSLTRENGSVVEFSLEEVKWRSLVSDRQALSLASIEIVDDKLAWAVIERGDSWHIVRLNLSNNTASTLTSQHFKRMVYREYPQKTEKFDRNLNLGNGQVMIVTDDQVGIYDANDETSYLTSLPNQLSMSELQSNHDIQLIWHRQAQSLLLWDKKQGLWPWFYTKQSDFEKATYAGASEAVNIHDSGWLSIVQGNSGASDSSTIVNLTDKRRFDSIPDQIDWIESIPNRLRILTHSFDIRRTEIWLDSQSGVVQSSRFIDYRLGLGESEKYYLDKGYLYRQSGDYITSLGSWEVPCNENATLVGDGNLHCIVNGQWQSFNPDNAHQQHAVTLSGYIQTYAQNEARIWAIANTDKSHVNVISRGLNGLSVDFQQQAENGCFHRLDLVDSNFVYVTLSKGGDSIFNNGPCAVSSPFSSAAFEVDEKNQLVVTLNPVNLDLSSNKGVYLPVYDIDGVYQDTTNRHWFSTQLGVVKRGLTMESFIWTKEKQPVYFSRNPQTDDLAVSEYYLSDDKQQVTLSLTIRDSAGTKVIQEVMSKSFGVKTAFTEYWLHGFSADGGLFWWAAYGDKSDINWVDLRAKKNPKAVEKLPQKMNVALDYLKFSLFGDFVIHAEPFTTGRHRVFSTISGEQVFEFVTQGGFAINKSRIDFHHDHPWLIYDGKVYDLSLQGKVIEVAYPDSIILFDFHPSRPWAAGRCGEQDVCIVDLQLGQVVMLKSLPEPNFTIVKKPEQIRFSQDGNSLLYVLAGRSLVEQQLFVD